MRMVAFHQQGNFISKSFCECECALGECAMGEKDENLRQVFITSDGIARRMTIVDDLIHDLSEKLVDDAGMEIGSGENVNEFKVSLSFNVDSLKNTFTWKLLFGSNNWRKLHGFNMRRKKCLR